MLTHTYFLQKLLGAARNDSTPDIYIYNIAPDLLAIHPRINSAKTHTIKRSLPLNSKYPKSLYVIFHLWVDDLSHYGYICPTEHDEFSVHAKGYSYIKGSHLIPLIFDLYKINGRDITYRDAVYQSHLIIEMIYDLVILSKMNLLKTIDVLVEAIDYTVNNKMTEFIETIHWLYGLDRNEIREVMDNALQFITKDGMREIMNIKGRINLYKDKFGLHNDEQIFNDCLTAIFQKAIDVIDDDETFFLETSQIVKNNNQFPFIK